MRFGLTKNVEEVSGYLKNRGNCEWLKIQFGYPATGKINEKCRTGKVCWVVANNDSEKIR
jgi:hypothetical protein